MTEIEAIEIFRAIQDVLSEMMNNSKSEDSKKALEAIRDSPKLAIQALKKQIPERPLGGGNHKYRGKIFICRSCSGVVGVDDMRADYCADCGQKLDWSEK